MTEPGQRRAHGQTAAEEEAKERGKELDLVPVLEEEKVISLTRGFQRMRTDWNSPDKDTVESVWAVVDAAILDRFGDAFGIEFMIFNMVREPEFDEATGEVKMDSYGLPIWKRRMDGSYYEDWSRITHKDRDSLLHEINTKMFGWEQAQAEAWGEALFAKALWEEAFATGFDTASEGKATVDARNARATRVSAEHRYFSVFKSVYSKKADAVVRSMERLSQRLKDLQV